MELQPAICTSLRYSARNNDEGSKEDEELMITVIYILGGLLRKSVKVGRSEMITTITNIFP